MNFKNYFVLYLFIFGLFISSCVNVDSSLEAVKVTSVIDGDTFYVNYGTTQESIRIIGIDTPEIHEGSKPVGEYGEDAKKFLEDFVNSFDIYLKKDGTDPYNRTLAYVFGKDKNGDLIFYEEAVLKEGLARPLIYLDNDDEELTPKIVEAYNYAFENKKGIFSKWDTAKVIKNRNEITNSLEGKIVFLEGKVNDIEKDEYYLEGIYHYKYNIDCIWFNITIRDGEYEYFFKDFDIYLLENENVRFYGELWFENEKPKILLRSPNEIVIN